MLSWRSGRICSALGKTRLGVASTVEAIHAIKMGVEMRDSRWLESRAIRMCTKISQYPSTGAPSFFTTDDIPVSPASICGLAPDNYNPGALISLLRDTCSVAFLWDLPNETITIASIDQTHTCLSSVSQKSSQPFPQNLHPGTEGCSVSNQRCGSIATIALFYVQLSSLSFFRDAYDISVAS